MNDIKILAKQTAIYGLSTTLGRFLNYLLIFLHMNVFKPDELGVVSNLYAYFAFLLVLLTYGTETGYFRFVEKEKDKNKIYSTLLTTLFITSTLFILISLLFPGYIARSINYNYKKEYIIYFGLIIGIDSFCSIPLARLRYENRAFDFAKINIISIVINIILNIYFLLLAPYLHKRFEAHNFFAIFNAEPDITYVFVANLVSSIGKFILLILIEKPKRIVFDFELLKRVMNYSYPILIIGLAGMINQNADKIVMPYLIDEGDNPYRQLGIYGANYKLSVIMIVFIQMFRYAAEPFFFSKEKEENAKEVYAKVMKYFVIFSLVITVTTVCFLDVLKFIVSDVYFSGSKIVPIVLLGNVFLGIYYNLSIWYKLTNHTLYGAVIAVIGSMTNILLNITLVPHIGYMGAAYACLVSYIIMMMISYLWGKKHYKIAYPIREIFMYFTVAILIIACCWFIDFDNIVLKYSIKTLLFFIFTGIIVFKEKRIIFEVLKRGNGSKNS